MGNKLKIDWSALKKEYTNGIEKDGRLYFPSMSELAIKYHCSIPAISGKSTRENWLEERKRIQEQTYQLATQKTIERRALSAAELDELCNTVATSLLRQLLELIEEDEEKPPIERSALRYSKNALELQKMARISLGLPTEETKQKQSISVQGEITALEEHIKSLDTNTLQSLLDDELEEGS